MSNVFRDHAPLYWARGLSAIPLQDRTKRPGAALGNWSGYCNNLPPEMKQREWLNQFGDSNIGLLMHMEIEPGFHLGAVDVDRDELVRVVEVTRTKRCHDHRFMNKRP